MANPHRGEVEVEVDGERLSLSLSINSICELEDRLDQPIDIIMADLFGKDSRRTKNVRAVFWAMMLDDKPTATIENASQLMVALAENQNEILAQVIAVTFPDPEKEPGLGKKRAAKTTAG